MIIAIKIKEKYKTKMEVLANTVESKHFL